MSYSYKMYTQHDFESLPKISVNTIEKELIELGCIEKNSDVREYMYLHREEISENEKINKIIQSQIFAGQGSIKWEKFTYKGFFTQNKLKKLIEDEKKQYEKELPDNFDDIKGDQIVSIWKNDTYYTIRIILDLGTYKVMNGLSYSLARNLESVIVNIDIDNCWIEIRTESKNCSRVENLLKNALMIENIETVKLTNKYKSVEEFKNDLYDGFFYHTLANTDKYIELTDEVMNDIISLCDIIDNYVNNRNSSILCTDIAKLKLDFGENSFTDLILSNIEGININTKNNATRDISNSFIYTATKKNLNENSAEIRFATVPGGNKQSLRVGLIKNTFQFRNNVEEDTITYIRNKLI